MKKFFVTALTIAVLSLPAPGSSIAAPYIFNQVGLYLTDDGLGPNVTYEVGQAVDVFLVLTNPTDTYNGYLPNDTVIAFEATLNFNPVPNNDLLLVATEFPFRSIEVGDDSDINQGFLEYIVGIDYNYPLLVANESVVLLRFTFINDNLTPTEVTLGPTSVPAIPGQMAYQSEQGAWMEAMHPISGSHDTPVFLFDSEPVAVENESFGSVKALYR